jgi:hypothetical protein
MKQHMPASQQKIIKLTLSNEKSLFNNHELFLSPPPE